MAAADLAAALGSARDSLDRAEQAEQAGDEETARAYRSRAREVLEATEAASIPAPARVASPAHRALVYEDDVMGALTRLNFSTRPEDPPADAKVVNPEDPARQANVVVKHRPQGHLTTGDLRRIRDEFAFRPISGGILVVTNAPLTEEVERHSREAPDHPRPYVVVTWNDERDDPRLEEAVRRAAR